MSSPHYEDGPVTLWHGDCLDVMRQLPDASVDAVVTDPPYGLANTDPGHVIEALTRWLAGDRDFLPDTGGGFMGKAWDSFVPPVAVWDEALRVLKPGGHVLAFAGSRTVDLMTLAIRLAGFEIRDSIAWLYGSGFPKSRNVTDEMATFLEQGPQQPDRPEQVINPGVYEVTGYLRAARDRAGWTNRRIDALFGTNGMAGHWTSNGTQPQCPSVRQWEILRQQLGFGHELDGLVEALAATERPEDWGSSPDRGERFLSTLGPRLEDSNTGWGSALKPSFEPVVVARKPLRGTLASNVLQYGTGALNIGGCRIGTAGGSRSVPTGDGNKPAAVYGTYGDTRPEAIDAGRWPPNVALDEHQAAVLDAQSGEAGGGFGRRGAVAFAGTEQGLFGIRATGETVGYGDTGGASRFFYTAKAPGSERPTVDGVGHPTVKPLDLMRWLIRLVTPPGGTVLEPFAGSGTTVEAAVLEGFRCVAIEREADYVPLILQRIRKPHAVGLDLGDWVAPDPTPVFEPAPRPVAVPAPQAVPGPRPVVRLESLTLTLDLGEDWGLDA